jgi:hypothetical protein
MHCIRFSFRFYLFTWYFLLKCLSLAAGRVNSILISLWILLQNPANQLYLMERFRLLVETDYRPKHHSYIYISIGMCPLPLGDDRLVTSSAFAL